jgi:hypothetical protein
MVGSPPPRRGILVPKEYPRNQACPCGSGKKYKVCCARKGFSFTVDEQGTVSRSVPLTPRTRELLDEQMKRFVEKFGRQPGPNDPVFFDPAADTPMPVKVDAAKMRSEFGEVAKKAGVPEELIYATNKTGILLTSENRHLVPDNEVKEFEDAVREYREMFGEECEGDETPPSKIGETASLGGSIGMFEVQLGWSCVIGQKHHHLTRTIKLPFVPQPDLEILLEDVPLTVKDVAWWHQEQRFWVEVDVPEKMYLEGSDEPVSLEEYVEKLVEEGFRDEVFEHDINERPPE